VFFMLRGDGGPLQVDAQKAAEAAAGAAGATFSQKFSATVKRAAGSAIGAAAGAAFSVALKGAADLDAATRKLQADTGMTASEAKVAEKSLAGMYRNNLQGFDAIGAAMAKVHNDLGLVGPAADVATEAFLRFSTATGIDAALAVSLFDDALGTWGLTAADTQMIMDKVILSHQKWGGEIDKNLVTLAKVAPAMTAANFTIDDGIALLGLFGAKGLDAERAAAAFSKALTKVKSPAELQQLITDISNTKDPFERAGKAADLFGAKAGAQLANALGGVAISEFTVSMTEAAGATDTAAAAIESGFGAKFKLLLKQASGALAEFGLNFGELAMVAAAFGPKFTTALLAGLGGLAGLIVPKIVGAIVAAQAPAVIAGAEIGTVTGTAIGVAIGPALALAIPAAILLGLQAIKPNIQKWLSDNGLSRLPNLFEGQGPLAPSAGLTPGTWETSPAGVAAAEARAAGKALTDALAAGVDDGAPSLARQVLATLGSVMFAGIASTETRARTSAAFDKLYEEIRSKQQAAARQTIAMLGSIMASGFAAMPVAADKVVAMFGTTLVAGVKKAATRTGIEGMLALAAGITSARQAPVDAFNAMLEMLKTPETSTQEAARLAGGLTSKALADGLRSHDPAIRAQAIAVKRMILDRLEELRTAKGIGAAAMDELADGIKSKDHEIRTAAQTALDTVLSGLEADAKARAAGVRVGSLFADGVGSTSYARFKSLEYPGQEAGGPVRAGMPYIVGEHRPELFVPQTNGYILPSVPAGAGQTFNFNGPITLGDSHDEFSLTQSLRFLAAVQG
jgi:hypothetical protein